MRNEESRLINVRVETRHLPDQSDPGAGRYAFAYTVAIENTGTVAAKLISRHWVITDANGKVQEVRGLGVVGEQPHLRPGEVFQYTSGTVLETPLGSMRGTYQMIGDDGVAFSAEIPIFTLSLPHSLH